MTVCISLKNGWKGSQVQRGKNRFGGGNCVTAKEKGSWFYVRGKERLHVFQEKPRIPVGHSRLGRPCFKEKEYLRAPQGKEGRNMSYIVFHSHHCISCHAKRVICVCNYTSLQGLHKHKISIIWEIWRKDRINYWVLLGPLNPEPDSFSSWVAD